MELFLQEDSVSKNKPQAASLAIAGAVEDNYCAMTNLSWIIDGPQLEKHFGFR